MLKNNPVSITIMLYFLASLFYIVEAPDLIDDQGPTFWDIYFFSVMYGLIILLGVYLFILSPETIDKYFSLALCIHSFCFLVFYVFHLGSGMQIYLHDCNSHEIKLIFTLISFVLISLVLIIYHIL